jgi:hypothetical protein
MAVGATGSTTSVAALSGAESRWLQKTMALSGRALKEEAIEQKAKTMKEERHEDCDNSIGRDA